MHVPTNKQQAIDQLGGLAAVAHHEAGHFVVACSTGMYYGAGGISLNGATQAFTVLAAPPDQVVARAKIFPIVDPLTPEGLQGLEHEHAIILAAGFAAQALYLMEQGRVAQRVDLFDLAESDSRLFDALFLGAHGDWVAIEELSNPCSLRTYVAAAASYLRRPDVWSATTAVARSLQRTGKLDDVRAYEIMDRHFPVTQFSVLTVTQDEHVR